MEDVLTQSILLVDDRPENLLVLENILEMPGLNLIKANSGEEALRLLLKNDVALVLLDVQMPGMDGFETAEIMRSAPGTRHIPIIFVTAISKEQKHIFRGYEAGAVDYMFKPVDPDILKSKVKVFLELDRRKKVVEQKNLELEEAKKNTDKILKNVRNGLFLLDREFRLKPQYSAVLEKILMRKNLANMSFIEFLENKIEDKIVKSCKDYLNLLYRESVHEGTLDKLNPLNDIKMIFKSDKSESGIIKILNFSFRRVYDNQNKIDEIIATVADNTEKITLAKKLEESEDHYKKQMELAFNILHVDPPLLIEFMDSVQTELNTIKKLLKNSEKTEQYSDTLDKVFRSIHLVKGNASLLDLKFFVNQTHEFEENIIKIQEKGKIEGSDFLPLVLRLEGIQKTISEINSLFERIKNIHDHFRPKREYENQLFVKSLENLAKNTAKDLNKQVKFDYKEFDLGNIPYNNRLLVKEVLIQLIRNSIFHGIEKSEERKKLKKSTTGVIALSSFNQDKQFGFTLKDDGKGIQLERLQEQAKSLKKWKDKDKSKWTSEDIIDLICLQGVSTSDKANHVAGRGVGMASVREKVEKIGGKIEVNYKENMFSEFTVTIPKSDVRN
ncbi:MAG: response regulator [Calditrichaceae bacterium]|nr:response regulator [Calditrichaceae bacterium]MBN2707835.1 response regulator [Calditrichaceae bacterium]RQV94902.1 MAG: response regulator [Calditrichota bacterium]